MGRRPITLRAIVLKEQGAGTEFEGRYLGFTVRTHPIYKDSKVHNFEASDGSHFSIYGFTMLDLKLAQVRINDYVYITYQGTEMVDTKNFGEKEVHQVDVDVNDDAVDEPPDSADSDKSTKTSSQPAEDPDKFAENLKFKMHKSKTLSMLKSIWEDSEAKRKKLAEEKQKELETYKDDCKEKLERELDF